MSLKKCSVYLFNGALSELLFALHKDALFHHQMNVEAAGNDKHTSLLQENILLHQPRRHLNILIFLKSRLCSQKMCCVAVKHSHFHIFFIFLLFRNKADSVCHLAFIIQYIYMYKNTQLLLLLEYTKTCINISTISHLYVQYFLASKQIYYHLLSHSI